MKFAMLISIVAVAASLFGCAGQPQQITHPEQNNSGETKETALNVCMPKGQQQYLASLSCPDGRPPAVERIGNVGPRNDAPNSEGKNELEEFARKLKGARLRPGELDTHIVDAYELSCGSSKRTVYLDMYHCEEPAPTVAPSGFRFKASALSTR